jgi:hypothetical protein
MKHTQFEVGFLFGYNDIVQIQNEAKNQLDRRCDDERLSSQLLTSSNKRDHLVASKILIVNKFLLSVIYENYIDKILERIRNVLLRPTWNVKDERLIFCLSKFAK